MGFMDKAKKLAEQAQTKLDEVQKDFNAKQGGSGEQGGGGSGVEYDEHGRPKAQPTAMTPGDLPATGSGDLGTPVGDPLTADPTSPGTTAASPDPAPAKAHGDALTSGEDASRHGADADRGERPPAPPSPGSGVTSGDPLG
jgi:hypothetical protein